MQHWVEIFDVTHDVSGLTKPKNGAVVLIGATSVIVEPVLIAA